jgi:putative flippase GtrA
MPIRKIFIEDVRSRFLLVGIVNTVVGFAIFTSLYFVLEDEVSYMLILLLSQIVAVMFSHSTQRNLVWKSESDYLPELTKFASSYLLITVVNLVLLRISVDFMDHPVLTSQYVIGALLIVVMFLVQKKWIFVKSGN